MDHLRGERSNQEPQTARGVNTESGMVATVATPGHERVCTVHTPQPDPVSTVDSPKAEKVLTVSTHKPPLASFCHPMTPPQRPMRVCVAMPASWKGKPGGGTLQVCCRFVRADFRKPARNLHRKRLEK